MAVMAANLELEPNINDPVNAITDTSAKCSTFADTIVLI